MSTREPVVRRVARAVLVTAVRGRRDRGGDWGEAVLAEFDLTRGNLEAVRWAAGGLRAVWHERRARAAQLPRRARISRRVAIGALAAVLGGVLVKQYVMAVGYQPGGDMEPTLLVGDRYLLDKIGFRVTGLQRGDVVAVTVGPGNAASTAVKRVIGLPGDTIECRDGRVVRNGVPLNETYLPDRAAAWTDCSPVAVPDGTLYLLGDHREVSTDSRHGKTFRRDAVQARLIFRVCHCGTEGVWGTWGVPPTSASSVAGG